MIRNRSMMVPVWASILLATCAATAETRFAYKLQPGQVWVCTQRGQGQSQVEAFQATNRGKQVFEYRVLEGSEPGWVALQVRSRSHVAQTEGEEAHAMNALEGMLFEAELHSSGTVRSYRYSGGNPMIAQATGPAMEHGMFWFPEFPDEPLAEGDEFEVTRKIRVPLSQGEMEITMETLSRTIYVLEEVRDGLAYFGVEQKNRSKHSTPFGDTSVEDRAEGEAIFDLAEGMWIDSEMKRRMSMNLPGAAAQTLGEEAVRYSHEEKTSFEREK